MSKIGNYPSCDHLNNALRDLLSDNPNILSAISEITYAIQKADGYFHADINEKLKHFLDRSQNEERIYSDMKLIKDAINDPNKNGFDTCRLIKSITDEYDFKEDKNGR
jgi:hypothetical protein